MVAEVVTVIGTRPQYIKASQVSRALRSAGVRETLVDTGQHWDHEMSTIFLDQLGLPKPHLNLQCRQSSHAAMTAQILLRLDEALNPRETTFVLVYGDTNSTLGAALWAAKEGIPVGHVEAGLRSGDRTMPEEINRILTDHVSSALFCPTLTAAANLSREGVHKGVYHVGDVMLDAVKSLGSQSALLDSLRTKLLEELQVSEGGYVLATVHRAENTRSKDQLASVLNYIRDHAGQPVVMPLHPRTTLAAEAYGLPLDGFKTLPPQGYLEMLALLTGCSSVITDSGGLQKEAFFVGRPCVTLRSSTEWPETIEAGWNRLWTETDFRPTRAIEDFGTGRAAESIARIVKEEY